MQCKEDDMINKAPTVGIDGAALAWHYDGDGRDGYGVGLLSGVSF